MTDLFDFIAERKSGTIALPLNRGIVVAEQQPPCLPAGWGFMDSATVTADQLRAMAALIDADARKSSLSAPSKAEKK